MENKMTYKFDKEQIKKEFREYLKESSAIHTGLKDNDWAEADESIRKLGKVFGKEVGVFGFKDNKERYMYLPENEISKGAFKNIKLNAGEYLARFITLTSSIGHGQAPLVKINPSKGLVWFLKDYEDDELEFENKSQKVAFIRTSLK